ncbi:MAG: DUF1360 domain-containing protein [Phycisphaerales bacterium JB038]
MNPITLLVLALATWRVSRILVEEDGPYDLFARLRNWLGVVDGDEGRYAEWVDTYHRYTVAELFSCIYCMSVWVGIFYAVLYAVSPVVSLWAGLPFALSAMALLINKVAD